MEADIGMNAILIPPFACIGPLPLQPTIERCYSLHAYQFQGCRQMCSSLQSFLSTVRVRDIQSERRMDGQIDNEPY